LLAVLEQVVLPQTKRGTRIDVHPSASWGWEHEWKYQGLANPERAPALGKADVAAHPFWLARGSGLSSDEQRTIAEHAHVRVYGDTWLVDQREPAGPLDAYSLNEREPNPLQWLFLGGTEPVRTVGAQPDPWLTWEYRTHLGQDAPPPQGEPHTLDQMRIAHNLAVALHDDAGAERWLEKIEAQLDRAPQTRFESDLTLIGVRVAGSAQPRVEAWFLVGDAPKGNAWFRISSAIEARAKLSLIPAPKAERDMAWPPSLPTKLWKRGFIYDVDAVMNHRIGRERYAGRWEARDGTWAPRRLDGKPDSPLVVVE
jgi:hypothetical protein